MKIGLLTSGGDTPGMNAVITGAFIYAKKYGHELIGFKYGWKGILEKDYVDENYLKEKVIKDSFLQWGGTVLRSSRTNPYKKDKGIEIIKKNLKELKIDALIAIGGEDTLGTANKLYNDGVNIVGVPKTIDNDLSATDYTFGFNTAFSIATDSLEKLHTTARSHSRTLVVEIMGRHSGWLTLYAAIAGRAHLALIPEFPISLDKINEIVKKRYEDKQKYCIIAVSEGYELSEFESEKTELDEFGHKSLAKFHIAEKIAERIQKDTGIETRSVVLGHVQRSGSPNAYDRVLAYRLGVKAAELVINEKFGFMSSLKGDQIVTVSLEQAVSKLKVVDENHWESAKPLFGL